MAALVVLAAVLLVAEADGRRFPFSISPVTGSFVPTAQVSSTVEVPTLTAATYPRPLSPTLTTSCQPDPVPPPATGRRCTQADLDNILADDTKPAILRCTGVITLPSSAVVKRRIEIVGEGATGLTLDCNGAVVDGRPAAAEAKNPTYWHQRIVVRSERKTVDGKTVWSRPEHVTVKRCQLYGAIRVYGMATNGEGSFLRESSGIPGHVERARRHAPRFVLFDQMRITSSKRTPFYVSPGATHVTLKNSILRGMAESAAVYLDAESGWNSVVDNDIQVTMPNRELIAIDGSERNRISGNYLSGLGKGGIFLYRNCGEKGTIRHTTPSHNQIINNVFYYSRGSGAYPSIVIGSRMGKRDYCDADRKAWPGVNVGSAASNYDHATHNVVLQNQFFHRVPSSTIRVGRESSGTVKTNVPTYVEGNQMVTSRITRKTGCYDPDGGLHNYLIPHGVSYQFVSASRGILKRCNEGVLGCSQWVDLTSVDFECYRSGSNSGCTRAVSCPAGRALVGITAACNLEWGKVTGSQLAAVPEGHIKVVRASDRVSSGVCSAWGTSLMSGQAFLGRHGVTGSSTSVMCREHDKNGGDCHIRGKLHCAP